jgi:hypothetical protein
MEDAIARGVEAALRCVLINKEFPVTKKHSPWRRKTEERNSGKRRTPRKAMKETFFW